MTAGNNLGLYLKLGATDLSDELTGLDIVEEQDTKDSTRKGDGGGKSTRASLVSFKVTVRVNQNEDKSTGLFAYLKANRGTNVAIEASNAGSTASSSNEILTGTVLVPRPKTGGNLGDLDSQTYEFMGQGLPVWDNGS